MTSVVLHQSHVPAAVVMCSALANESSLGHHHVLDGAAERDEAMEVGLVGPPTGSVHEGNLTVVCKIPRTNGSPQVNDKEESLAKGNKISEIHDNSGHDSAL